MEDRDAAGLSYASFLHEYVRSFRPVIVRNATPDWPALRKWTPQFFKERFADRAVKVSFDLTMRFDDFIDAMLASTADKPGPYMYRLFLHEHLPDVLADLSPQNPFAFPGRYASPLMMEYWRRPDGYLKLLIGGVGGRFPVMHFDGENAHATITEIYGDKDFIVYPPSDGAYLYPDPKRPNHSLVDDPSNQDLARFPLLARARQLRGVLGPGDMVFVPCGWWHTARALNPSISVGMNLRDRSNWKGFVDEIGGASLRPRKIAKRAYLRALGPTLTAVEAVQKLFPRVAFLAPDSSAAVADPSKKTLQIAVPTG